MGGNFLNYFSWLNPSFLVYVIPALFILTIIVFVHELGHFLVARWCGVRVMVFSVGFGPELAGFNDRYGTRWKFAAIPLGGYVKFYGDENAASVPDSATIASMTDEERRDSFAGKPLPSRAAIVAAGPIANFLLAIVIFAGIAMVFGKQSVPPRVGTIVPESAAAAAGFQPGDLVKSIDGRNISDFADMQRIVALSAGRSLAIVVQRNDVQVALKATPALQEMKDNFGNVQRIGVLGIQAAPPGPQKAEPLGPLPALALGVERTWDIVDSTLTYIGGLIMGRQSADQLGGPARIAQISGQVWKHGMESGGFLSALIYLINLGGALSVSIGLLNLFPVPLLDGGHLLFYAIEAVRGRPISERAQEVGFRIGFALVLMLMIFATYQDILHFRIL